VAKGKKGRGVGEEEAVPDLRGPGSPGLPSTGGLLPNPSIFWLMIDVSIVILI